MKKNYDKKTVGLERKTYKKNRQWAVDNLDQDLGYMEDLKKKAAAGCKESQEAIAFMAKFNNEYYNNTGLKNEDALHNTDELRKECYNRTNAANRDLYSISDSVGMIMSTEEENCPDDEHLVEGEFSSRSTSPVGISGMDHTKPSPVRTITLTEEEKTAYLAKYNKAGK